MCHLGLIKPCHQIWDILLVGSSEVTIFSRLTERLFSRLCIIATPMTCESHNQRRRKSDGFVWWPWRDTASREYFCDVVNILATSRIYSRQVANMFATSWIFLRRREFIHDKSRILSWLVANIFTMSWIFLRLVTNIFTTRREYFHD